MKYLIKLFLLVCFSSALASTPAALTNSTSETQQSGFMNRVVAIVNNQVITQNQLNVAIQEAKAMAAQSGISIPDEQSFDQQVLNQLITRTIALELAKLNNITVSDDQVNLAIASVLEHNGMTLQQLKTSITQSGLGFDQYQENLKEQLILNKLEQQAVANNIMVSQSEVANYLAQQDRDGGMNTLYDVQHILIALPDNPTPSQVDATAQKAQQVRDQINQGLSFTEAAIKYSSAGDALQGGDLGWISLDQLNPNLAAIIPNMAYNKVSDPIQVGDDWYLLMVAGQRQYNDTDDYLKRQAEMAIFQRKAGQAVQTWQAQIRGASYVKIVAPEYQDASSS